MYKLSVLVEKELVVVVVLNTSVHYDFRFINVLRIFPHVLKLPCFLLTKLLNFYLHKKNELYLH